MIDRKARQNASELLGRWRTGTVTNWEFEDQWPASQDRGVRAIGSRLSCFYSDSPKSVLSVSALHDDELELLNRCAIFLQSDEEYAWPDFDFEREGLRPLEALFRGQGTKTQRWREFASTGNIAKWPFLESGD